MSEASPPPPEPAPRRSGRWLAVALVISVGLNLLVAGFVAGALLSREARDGRPAPAALARDLGLGPYVAALSPSDRRAIGRAVRAEIRAQGAPDRGRIEIRRSFAGVLAALRAEPFDEGALADLLAAQVERAESRRRLGQEAFVAQLAEMTPQERRAFADRLERILTRGRGLPNGSR